jgi:hypothetical protein
MLGSKPHLWPGLVEGILLDRAACSASQESPGRTGFRRYPATLKHRPGLAINRVIFIPRGPDGSLKEDRPSVTKSKRLAQGPGSG